SLESSVRDEPLHNERHIIRRVGGELLWLIEAALAYSVVQRLDCRSGSPERMLPCDRLVRHDAHGIEIAPAPGRTASELLRRHVEIRSDPRRILGVARHVQYTC